MNYQTPNDIYRTLNNIFYFNFDPCPPNPTFDGLLIDWKESNFVNPPYGQAIGKWIFKAAHEANKGKLVVILIPARTDTAYWHNYVLRAHEIWFIKRRLRFIDQEFDAPFPSVIVIFRGKLRDFNHQPIIKSVNTKGLLVINNAE